MHFYLASGFFNNKEIEQVETVERILTEKGHTFFSPMRCQLDKIYDDKDKWRMYTYKNDIANVNNSDAMIGIVDGNYIDSGTAFELGYAHANGINTFIYNPTGKLLNLMLVESAQAYLEGEEELKNYDFDAMSLKPYNKDSY